MAGSQLREDAEGLLASTALVEPSQPVPLVGKDSKLLDLTWRLAERLIHPSPKTTMVPRQLMVDGRRLLFAVSDNEDAHGPEGPGSPPVWAVNLHGYFAGGETYWRESAILADRFGWRMINPSLPGFGGSDPLDWNQVDIEALSDRIAMIVEDVGAGPLIMLGHSMGAAVAVHYAVEHPESVLGLIYRDGVATPAWKERHGVLGTLLTPALPDVAPLADLVAAAVLDTPDLLLGRIYANLRAVLPDLRRNFRTVARNLPVASMLMNTDLRGDVRTLVASRLPILIEWGCFDRVANAATADEMAATAGLPIQWVPGGHSWMLARPQGQAAILAYLKSGKTFLAAVDGRRRSLADGAEHPVATIQSGELQKRRRSGAAAASIKVRPAT